MTRAFLFHGFHAPNAWQFVIKGTEGTRSQETTLELEQILE
jgi:hypothetical protein